MTTNIPGIDPALAAKFDERSWRLLVHPRSLARGIYRRGTEDDETFTSPQSLAAHLKTTAKDGFLLVEVLDAAAAFTGPWVSEVE